MEDKVFLVKRYKRFPKAMFQDKTIEKFDSLMEAQAYSMRLNKESEDERYYVIDSPHTWVELSEDTKRKIAELKNKFSSKNNGK